MAQDNDLYSGSVIDFDRIISEHNASRVKPSPIAIPQFEQDSYFQHPYHERRQFPVLSSGITAKQQSFPFQVITFNNDGLWQYGVIRQSYLFDIDPTTDPASPSLMSINGLLPDSPTPVDQAWIFWTGSTDPIWLYSPVSSGQADINSYGAGSSYGDGDCEDDAGTPPVQTAWRKLIAVVSDDGTGKPIVTQYVTTSLRLLNTAMMSSTSSVIIPAVYPF